LPVFWLDVSLTIDDEPAFFAEIERRLGN
jgi:hypothetical protein